MLIKFFAWRKKYRRLAIVLWCCSLAFVICFTVYQQTSLYDFTAWTPPLVTSNVNAFDRLPRLVTMSLLTDGNNRTKIEWPWLETKKVVQECQSRGSAFYRSAGRLPNVSVIITFHSGETLYNLLHTLHSIFQRSPPDILHQIILFDDFSQKDDFGEPLEMYARTVFGSKVQIIRNERNIGLIQSRLKGIRQSTGEVFVVMDSHSEVQPLWLEPMAYEISLNRRTLANSFIDWMSKQHDGWEYKYSGLGWTVYMDWTLGFGWQTMGSDDIERRQIADPIITKVVIGTSAAMGRKFFEEIGAFDEGMTLWGGENIDLAIRTWLFGGRVISVPCSRVAHLESPGSRDYRANFTSEIERNYKRVVEVWFDDYKKYFYAYKPSALELDAGDLTQRFALKSRALHEFDWFLKNVSPELGMFDRDSFAWGLLMNTGSKLCLDMNAELTPYSCSKSSGNQMFYWSDKFELRRDITIVLSKPFFADKLVVNEYTPFYNNDRATKWIHWKGGPVVDLSTMKCLEGGRVSLKVGLKTCHYRPSQLWTFTNYSADYERLLAEGSTRYQQHAGTLRSLLRQFGPLVDLAGGSIRRGSNLQTRLKLT